MQNNDKKVLLRISNLKQYFPLKGGRFVKANDGITLDIYEGETFGLVGESGCGKSTLGRTILQLYHQTYGRTMYYGRSLDDLAPKYVIDTVKNLKARRTKLRELEQKRDKLEADYAKLSEKEQYAKHECPVVSNNSANRFTPDVPMVVPELNPQHIDIIPAQRKRLGTKRGFIAVKSNCSLQSYVPAIFPLHKKYGIKRVLVCTYQAISGAGKTFERWPEMIDNVIPYIGGEEEKSEKEPLKLMGHIEGDQIVSADAPAFTAQCIRVPVTNGHLGAVFMDFEGEKPSEEEIIEVWKNYAGRAQELKLPSAPKQFLHYFTEPPADSQRA